MSSIIVTYVYVYSRAAPIMLLILPIILARNSITIYSIGARSPGVRITLPTNHSTNHLAIHDCLHCIEMFKKSINMVATI